MIETLKQILPAIEAWPDEDQQALAEAARDIEAMRTGFYRATAEELAAIDRALSDARAGRFASDDALAAIRAKFSRP